MIGVTGFENQKVAVLGLGRTGNSASLALKVGNAEILAWDDNSEIRAQAEKQGVSLYDLATVEWGQVTALILSPGISETHPYAIKAAQAGIPILCDIELLARMQKAANFIGITGTNGKSTTTWLISHLLRSAGQRIEVGGNIGKAVLELHPLQSGETYVLELSSYQLERVYTPFLKTAVLLNITPDHLDRHGSMAGYVHAKEQIFSLQRAPKNAVISVDDSECLALYQKLLKTKDHIIVPISTQTAVPKGVYVLDGLLIDHRTDKAEPILDLKTIKSLPGNHNWQNIAAAYAATCFEGLSKEQFIHALQTFKNLSHRLEDVAVVDRIHFINDSKATNADAVAKALACYENNIFWILGGRAKENELEGLEPYFSRIQYAFLIGEAMPRFAKILEGKVPYLYCTELAKAVHEAYAKARASTGRPAYILLSPACASWDQFKDFEHRGEVFKSIVGHLAKEVEGL